MMAAHDTTALGRTVVPDSERERFRNSWSNIQARFVDDPSAATQEASQFLADVVQRINDALLNEKVNIDARWNNGDQTSTEILRTCLQSYRAHLERLLTVEFQQRVPTADVEADGVERAQPPHAPNSTRGSSPDGR